MASKKQVAANRQNAAKSTGPKSAQGKQVARMNALKHGLQAQHVVIPGEYPEEFETLLRSRESHYKPIGPIERGLVEKIAIETRRQQRASLTETAILRTAHFSLQKERAGDEKDLEFFKLHYLARGFDVGPNEDDLQEDDDLDDGDGHHPSNSPLRHQEKKPQIGSVPQARSSYQCDRRARIADPRPGAATMESGHTSSP